MLARSEASGRVSYLLALLLVLPRLAHRSTFPDKQLPELPLLSGDCWYAVDLIDCGLDFVFGRTADNAISAP